MNFGTILYTIIIGPLQLFFEFIFNFAQRFTNNPGLSIVVLSLIMNFLVLPLYKRADAMQAEERDAEAKLHDGLAHIKKSFSGDERMMIQQEYYHRNNYKPTDALKGSISLFLEIPFFIGAYQFLSHLQILQGVSFGPLNDLSAQDGLLVINGMNINILPIIMTVVNMISCIIYTKGFPLKTKIQLYTMAIFFLFFLYDSPSGLVFYWTLNNIFSLLKNIFYKIKNPKKVLAIISSITGVLLVIFVIVIWQSSLNNKLILLAISLALQLPAILLLIKAKKQEKEWVPDNKRFLLSALLLSIILGLLIPSAVIKSSPQEFVNIFDYHNPLWYVISSFCLSFGTCLIWFGVFYKLADKKGKVIFERLMLSLCIISLIDYMSFGTNLGILSSTLKYDNDFQFTKIQMLINIMILIMASLAIIYISKKYKKFLSGVLLTSIIAIFCMTIMNTIEINRSVNLLSKSITDEKYSSPKIRLSKSGKNVVVIMLDRALGPYIPYIFNEKPELKSKFDGFTYYSNTVSFGGFTNFGTPALYGGYEYMPINLNKRSSESLVSKQNEALKVMPVLFDKNGYDVTVFDPTYANYGWVPDTSIYDEYPNIHAYVTEGKFNDAKAKKEIFENDKRNFFCYSLMKSAPLFLQHFLYNYGNYMKPMSNDSVYYSSQIITGNSISTGLNTASMDSYNVLDNMTNITEISDNSTGSFFMMSNDTTHEPQLLQEPEYEPKMKVDNTVYDQNISRFTIDGRTMKMDNSNDYAHYEVNMASMLEMAKWFDYLRENNLYDNTRIILVSDHGRPLNQFEQLMYENSDSTMMDMEWYTPLLMVKDYNSKGFTTSDSFMTNGDVPTIATSDVISDPINPMTGNKINNNPKYNDQLYVVASMDWDTNKNNGNTYLPADWYSIHDNIWDLNNWSQVAQNTTNPNN